ncbi:DUF2508 domain-containing protein [Desulforamulus putei]|uniref:DUF2508 domain-containing protein n=1 Tax=Desulforamulus putei TaxID=74701 RepID=UPI002FDDB85D
MKVDRQIFQCLVKDFSWRKLKKAIFLNKTRDHEFTLERQIEQARQAWLIAQEQMQWADKDLLEAAILKTTACEKRYIALLQKAKSMHYVAWEPAKIAPVVANNR